MTVQQQNNLIESLIEHGFDESYAKEDGTVKVRCSQCQALVINGFSCHETGCPNASKSHDYEDDSGEE